MEQSRILILIDIKMNMIQLYLILIIQLLIYYLI